MECISPSFESSSSSSMQITQNHPSETTTTRTMTTMMTTPAAAMTTTSIDLDLNHPPPEKKPLQSRVIVLGGTVIDIVAKPERGHQLLFNTSNPAICTESDGGVGRNVAETLRRLGSEPILYSAVGCDSRGKAILGRLETDCGIRHVQSTIPMIPHTNTAMFVAILDDTGDLHTACADMVVNTQIPVPPLDVLERGEILIMDANPLPTVLMETAQNASKMGLTVCFEPTSVPKTRTILQQHPEFLSHVSYAFPNRDEFLCMVEEVHKQHAATADTNDNKGVTEGGKTQSITTTTTTAITYDDDETDPFASLKNLACDLLQYMSPKEAHLIITLGSDGVLLASRGGVTKTNTPTTTSTTTSTTRTTMTTTAATTTTMTTNPSDTTTTTDTPSSSSSSSSSLGVSFRHFPPPPPPSSRSKVLQNNSTGAGDTLCGAFIHGILQGMDISEAISLGMEAAIMSIQCSNRTISPHLSSSFSPPTPNKTNKTSS